MTLCDVCVCLFSCKPDYCIIVSPLDKPKCFWGKQLLICLNKKKTLLNLWDLLYTSDRLIDSRRFIDENSRNSDSLISRGHYYSAHLKTGHCKYMSRKTIAFWAMKGINCRRTRNFARFYQQQM